MEYRKLPNISTHSGVTTSYHDELGKFFRDHKVAIPAWNKYIVPMTRYIKPYLTKICRKLGLSSEIYKSDVYFSIKEYLKKSKDNIVQIPGVGTVFLHQVNPNVHYHGDRRLRPDICISIIKDLLIFLGEDTIRFFETYYCDTEVLAIEFIDPCVSLRKEISASSNKDQLKAYYQVISSRIVDYFDYTYKSLGGSCYVMSNELMIVLDISPDNILFEGYNHEGIPQLLLMDVFYLKEM